MAKTALRNDEILGLGAAVLLHGGLLGVLLMEPEPDPIPPVPERVTVSLAADIGLDSTAPAIVRESRAATAPTLSDIPTPPSADPAVANPEPAAAVARRPSTRTPPATRRPARRSQPRNENPRRRPDKPASRPKPPANAPTRPNGSTRLGENFLDGAGSSTRTNETRPPANSLGPSELASLDSAVGRQVRIKWQGRVPQGPDAEKLVTRVRFRLNPDGTLAGQPKVVGQTTGVTALNRQQVGRHQEEAIRAIKLVGRFRLPFDVPAKYSTFTLKFDRN